MILTENKRHLLASIDTIISTPKQFVLHPDKDFSRTSPLSLKQMIAAILTMGGKSLSKELLDLDLPVSPSAFVQRRYRIKSQAFYDLFKDFTAKLPSPNDLPVLAVDGSDVSIPRNRLWIKAPLFKRGRVILPTISFTSTPSMSWRAELIKTLSFKIRRRRMNELPW